MSALDDLARVEALQVWDGVIARSVEGERVALALVELELGSVVAEHHHENEQLGLVLSGSVTFRVGDETRELGPGGTWRIPPNTPHEVHAGAEGAVVVDVFSPPRHDWSALEPASRPARWP